MTIPIIQVDAFTNEPFGGNPAAVCVLPKSPDERWMQRVAGEMNLSETAFLHKAADGYNLRWFTPVTEVELCGHATLASAHVLWTEKHLSPDTVARFHTRSGVLTATRRADDWIELNFPAKPEQAVPHPATLLQALGVDAPRYVGKNQFDYIVEVAHEADVAALQPDFTRLKTLGVRGIVVTARAASADFDFVSRFFAPGSGVDEDPVTGSAHCCLGPFWQTRLGKSEFLARQISARGGTVRVRVEGERVHLGGQAVTVLRGELLG